MPRHSPRHQPSSICGPEGIYRLERENEGKEDEKEIMRKRNRDYDEMNLPEIKGL